MSVYRIKSFAKINLALNITGKSTLLHKIESIFSFVELHDDIFVKKINAFNHRVSFFGKFSGASPTTGGIRCKPGLFL